MGPHPQLLRGIDKLVEYRFGLRAEKVGANDTPLPRRTLAVEVPKSSVIGSLKGGQVERVNYQPSFFPWGPPGFWGDSRRQCGMEA